MTIDTPDEILRRIRSAEFPHDMPVSRALVQWIGEQRPSEDISNAPGLVASQERLEIIKSRRRGG
jgi:hypothetical protein